VVELGMKTKKDEEEDEAKFFLGKYPWIMNTRTPRCIW
jgi:hypothetical protein